jgi:FixJ family two-component response regulator
MNENGSKVHIAIVDDDALVRESLCDCVESAGYSAEGFASAEEF